MLSFGFWQCVRSMLILRKIAEGMREKEKPIMTTLLRQVAFIRDNTYHLHRYVWNDVQEDWPFYTEQERTMLRRRKPQNLTPPGSSDGSTGTSLSKCYIYNGTSRQNVIYN